MKRFSSASYPKSYTVGTMPCGLLKALLQHRPVSFRSDALP